MERHTKQATAVMLWRPDAARIRNALLWYGMDTDWNSRHKGSELRKKKKIKRLSELWEFKLTSRRNFGYWVLAMVFILS